MHSQGENKTAGIALERAGLFSLDSAARICLRFLERAHRKGYCSTKTGEAVLCPQCAAYDFIRALDIIMAFPLRKIGARKFTRESPSGNFHYDYSLY